MGLKWIPCFGLLIFNLINNLTIPVGVLIQAVLDLLDKTNTIITINKKTKNATIFSWMTKISHRLVILDNIIIVIHTILLTHPLPPPQLLRSINSHSFHLHRISTSNFPAGGPLIFSLKLPGLFLTGTALAFSNSCGC